MRIGCLLLLNLVVLFGCGGQTGPERVVLTGTVTYQGEPIPKGSIRFIPTGETKGPNSGSNIQDGTYEAKARGGVVLGTHRVEIRATRPTGESKPKATQHLNEFPEPTEQYLPAKYNDESELTLEVTASERTHNFNLD